MSALISLKKISAGSGYDYLIRQVAAQDATIGTGLAAYYEQKGETPGVWLGSGLAGLDGINAGDPVTEAQMRALFGHGLHPLADEIRQAALAAGLTEEQAQAACRLGRPFANRAAGLSPFQEELKRRYGQANARAGRPVNAPLDAEVRARIRSEVARRFFIREFGRPPASPRELHAAVARWSRPAVTTVAGFDLTLSPVKSVSTLWAVAGLRNARIVERLHHEAVAKAAEYLESRLYTRVGPHGVRHVETRGMVAVAFTHRDSRAGDPDLHTHLVVANKVQTPDGRWYAINGRLLYEAKVAASETYTTVLERGLVETLGLRFVERSTGAGKRTVREVAGIDPELNARWSTRRGQIEQRRDELAARFLADHGRPPIEAEMIALAQQANLETRDAKHAPRSLAEQRKAWREQADQVLGAGGVDGMLSDVLGGTPQLDAAPSRSWMAEASERVIGALEAERPTWQETHVRAEAQRQARAAGIASAHLDRDVAFLVDLAVARSVPLSIGDPIEEPDALRRSDGSSVYTVPGEARYTSHRIIEAEQRILAHASRATGRIVPPQVVDLALLEAVANGTELTTGQTELVRSMACSGRRVQLAIAPAGTGKTTAMRTLAAAWVESGGTVVGLAPSAAAAKALGDQLDAPCDTLAKLVWSLDHPDQPRPDWVDSLDDRSLVIIDEAGMADTLSLARVIDHVGTRDGSIRLVGDDRQLAAIGAGGVLRDIETTYGAARLDEVLRFSDPAEAAASQALREGRREALGFYLDHRRIHVADLATATQQVLHAWTTDQTAGLDALMLAPTRELVSELNRMAQARRHAGAIVGQEAVLADGSRCAAGDVVITRHNSRQLRTGRQDWVKNGDRWLVTHAAPDGSLTVRRLATRGAVRLPAKYVSAWVELGYATTIHAAQGITADTMHGLATGEETRQQLYTMLTRGRHANHLYLQVVSDGDPHALAHTDLLHLLTAVERLEHALNRDETATSATTLLREQADPATLLAPAVARYTDALAIAAEHVLGTQSVQKLDDTADRIVLWLSQSPAWPTLRADLLGKAVHGHDPVTLLRRIVAMGDLDAAHDPASVLDHRLHLLAPQAAPGPLPWLRDIPARVAADPVWGPYLHARATRIHDLADTIQESAATSRVAPPWLAELRLLRHQPEAVQIVGDVEVWRAAMGVPRTDDRPTGQPATGVLAARWQDDLDGRLARLSGGYASDWTRILPTLDPGMARDSLLPLVAQRLEILERRGGDAHALVSRALAFGPLPDEYAAAALWSRVDKLDRASQQRSASHPDLRSRRPSAGNYYPRSSARGPHFGR